jgi:hypothetical protein
VKQSIIVFSPVKHGVVVLYQGDLWDVGRSQVMEENVIDNNVQEGTQIILYSCQGDLNIPTNRFATT